MLKNAACQKKKRTFFSFLFYNLIIQAYELSMKPLLSFALVFFFLYAFAGDKNLCLVENGRANAVIVTADQPSPSAAYAASELREYLAKATGVTLPLMKESSVSPEQACIYVGATKAAERVALGQDRFPHEAYAVKTVGHNLYLVGGENGHPLFYEKSKKDFSSGILAFLETAESGAGEGQCGGGVAPSSLELH